MMAFLMRLSCSKDEPDVGHPLGLTGGTLALDVIPQRRRLGCTSQGCRLEPALEPIDPIWQFVVIPLSSLRRLTPIQRVHFTSFKHLIDHDG